MLGDTTRRGLSIATVVALSAWALGAGANPDDEVAALQAASREAQRAISALSGFPEGEPVGVEVRSKAELRDYVHRMLEREYPGDLLARQSRCFAEIGLLPRGYDLARGARALVDEQAGGYYDPYSKAFLAIAGAHGTEPPGRGKRLVIGHELCHALQDRARSLLDGLALDRDSHDAAYAFRAVMEGTAMVAGMAWAGGVGVGELGDVGAQMRGMIAAYNATLPAFAASPVYLQQLLIAPYIDGSILAQAYIADGAGRTLADLFGAPPVTAEQALHYDKLVAGEVPARIDLTAAEQEMGGSWRGFYANTLGEFELRSLFLSHPETAERAVELAAGWNGARVAGLETEVGGTAVVVASAWDSEADAREFADAMSAILSSIHRDGAFEVASRGARVALVTGLEAAGDRRALLDVLLGACIR